MAQVNMNLQNYDAQEGFDTLPPGWYPARIADSEVKNGDKGPYINWTFEIEGKPNKVWDVMSLGNEISLRRLKTLAVCAGHPNPNFVADTQELHGLRCLVRLKIETDPSGQYDPKNKVTAFKRIGEGQGNVPPPASAAAPAYPQPSTRPVNPLADNRPPEGYQPPAEQSAPAPRPLMPWEKAA